MSAPVVENALESFRMFSALDKLIRPCPSPATWFVVSELVNRDLGLQWPLLLYAAVTLRVSSHHLLLAPDENSTSKGIYPGVVDYRANYQNTTCLSNLAFLP